MTISHANPSFLGPAGAGEPAIVIARGDLLLPAVSRLVTTSSDLNVEAAERFLRYAREHRIDLERLYAAVESNGVVDAAALAVPSPGKTAMIFASRLGRRPPPGSRLSARVAAVIDAACIHVRDEGVRVAQALLEPRERLEQSIFERAGFEVLANLSYLQRTLALRAPEREPVTWPDGITIEQFSDAAVGDFITALDRSYENTLDCPRLCGLRPTRDILAGHRATGQFDPALWTLLRIDEAPTGVLLINPTPGPGSAELVYLGLAADARGRGLGEKLLRHGLQQAAARSIRTLSLAVDERNTPALKLYAGMGLRRLLRRLALIRVLEAADVGTR